MQQPHVDELIYRLVPGTGIAFEAESSVTTSTPELDVQLTGEVLSLRPKGHFSSVEDARVVSDRFVQAWEVFAGASTARDVGTFIFQSARLHDLSAAPGAPTAALQVAGQVQGVGSLQVRLPQMPSPPGPGFVLTPEAVALWNRYRQYIHNAEPLLSMAFACCSHLESLAGNRGKAAKMYGVEEGVLRKIGELTSRRGDAMTARKHGTYPPLSDTETAWLQAVIPKLVLRAAEPSAIPELRMSDLPTL
jgi:hypothetical protein